MKNKRIYINPIEVEPYRACQLIASIYYFYPKQIDKGIGYTESIDNELIVARVTNLTKDFIKWEVGKAYDNTKA